jgi:ribosome-interacting GTPase 1
MPTNLPPEYFAVEKRYRAAGSPQDKIACLEELIGTIPKHKGTDRLRADLRKKLSRLKSSAQGKKGVSRQVSAYHIDKEGEGQLVVIGPTNVGKSALVASLTNAAPQVAGAPFTTWQPTPGMMPIENIQVQLIDTPPLNRDYVEPDMLDLLRRSDLLLLLLDLQADPVQQLQDAVELLQEQRIAPLHLQQAFDEPDRLTFKPFLVLVNKYDDESLDEDYEIFRELLDDDGWPLLPISAASGYNVEAFKQSVFQQLGIMRVYSRPPGKEPDFSAPFVLDQGANVADFAAQVHKDFFEQLKSARVWGSSALYEGQMVGRDHVLQDGDVVELRL